MFFSKLLKAFRVMSITGEWFENAIADGQIDSKEAGELVTKLGETLGFKVKLSPDQ